jgi:hypothetical protein
LHSLRPWQKERTVLPSKSPLFSKDKTLIDLTLLFNRTPPKRLLSHLMQDPFLSSNAVPSPLPQSTPHNTEEVVRR